MPVSDEVLLNHLPIEDASITYSTWAVISGLTDDEIRIRSRELRSRGFISIGRGRGGRIRRLSADVSKLVAVLVHFGGEASTAEMTGHALLAGWDQSRFEAARSSARREGLLDVGRGRGGKNWLDGPALSLVVQAEPTAEVQSESHLYPLIIRFLEGADAGFRYQFKDVAEFAIVCTARGGGRRDGKWARPDLVVATSHPTKFVLRTPFDLWSFEVKAPGAWNVDAVHEAMAHGRFCTKPYVWIVETTERARRGFLNEDARFNAVLEEATRCGVGLVTSACTSAAGVTEFEWWCDPPPREPHPDNVELFVQRQLREIHDRLSEWGAED